MIRNSLGLGAAVCLFLSLASPGHVTGTAAPGVPFTIQDDAGLFSAPARDKANADIAQLKKRLHKDLLIETFAHAPKEIDKVDLKNEDAKSKFFKSWAIDRAKKTRVDGVYILICADPKYVQPVVGEITRKSGQFTDNNLKVLGNKLRESLKVGKPDEALTEAVGYVKETMEDQAPKAQPTKKTGGTPYPANEDGGFNWMGLVCFGLLVIGVIWLIVGVVRAFSGPRYGYGGGGAGGGYGGGGYGPGYGGSGGGFFPSLFGGLFGGMAGMWMYDRFFGGHSTHGGGYTPPSTDGYNSAPPPSDVGGDYSAGGGGDFGGGGGGGGDWGGGGGGDFGGGGSSDGGGGW